MNNNNNECKAFKAHQLRPDKCRNCFGDKSRHPESETIKDAPPVDEKATSEKDQILEKERPSKNSTPTPKASTETASNNKQLTDELSKCQEEKEKWLETEKQYKNEIERLRSELELSAKGREEKNEESSSKLKTRCELAESERDRAKEELKALEREMEEMHDNFKEEESEQFEQLKQELDLAMKNCKILQIRLNKSERQYNQLEQVKGMLERQLEDSVSSTNNNNSNSSSSNASKSQTTTTTQQNLGFVQLGADSVRLSTSEYDQLLRDLNDTSERERDLQEQIKYSQEEAQLKGDRLSAIEAENEVLLNKVNKLTQANSRLRSNALRTASLSSASSSMDRNDSETSDDHATTPTNANPNPAESMLARAQQASRAKQEALSERKELTENLIQQNEQLKLAFELAQCESERMRAKWEESVSLIESRELQVKECEMKRAKVENELVRLKAMRERRSAADSQQSSPTNNAVDDDHSIVHGMSELIGKLELECRQLRTKLVHSERECKQLKVQLQETSSEYSSEKKEEGAGTVRVHGEQAKLRELNRQLREECDSLRNQLVAMEKKVEKLSTEANVGQTLMESDLLEKLKQELDLSESELAKARSRLVELDLENTRLQRQYKRLVESIETSKNDTSIEATRKIKLPAESARDTMSRQELRRALKDLEQELEECYVTIRSKNSLIKELQKDDNKKPATGAPSSDNKTGDDQVKTLQRLLDQEKLMSNNLKIEVKRLEKTKTELSNQVSMFERERGAIEEELEKLRQVNYESYVSSEDSKRNYRLAGQRLKDLQVECERLRVELSETQQAAEDGKPTPTTSGQLQRTPDDQQQRQLSFASGKQGSSSDLMLMARDLSELKVKNGFLMRQLELAREDSTRQLDDLRQQNELSQRRVIELAQIELKERHLAESQQLRDELNELKQKLALAQRQAARNEEEASGERDRLRSMERDWRRDKSQWQQRIEQLEAQLTLERRSNEFKLKEFESLMKEKERGLLGFQDKYVQLERDFKRLQNKYNLLEENSDSKEKNLARELEIKKRELSELIDQSQAREDEYYGNCKRFNSEKSALLEALESIRQSYDEKLGELKSVRELLMIRQDQAYKERMHLQERIDGLNNQLIKAGELEFQVNLLKQQMQMQEKQADNFKRESMQLKEDKLRLKTKCEDLERKCFQYEKQELITKTSNISSSSSTNFLFRAKNPFSGQQTNVAPAVAPNSKSAKHLATIEKGTTTDAAATVVGVQDSTAENKSQTLLVEKLTSKINDQRHLINLLKQQHDESQLQLKQMKLFQSSEKNKWQSRFSLLKSQLSECEEKLLFEKSNQLSQETFDNSRRKFELKWNDERQSMLEMIQQQQTQNELLARDLKKLTQSHDLLRLQSKQLQAQNNKLSKKLIEYQQQQQSNSPKQVNFSATKTLTQTPVNDDLRLEQSEWRSERRVLIERQAQLVEVNKKLVNLMRKETKPLVETVTKIVNSLDESATKTVNETASAGITPDEQSKGLSNNPSDLKVAPVSPLSLSSDQCKSNSRIRPLVTTPTSPTKSLQQSEDELSNVSSRTDLNLSINQSPLKHQHQSRFSRFLGKQPKGTLSESPEPKQNPKSNDQESTSKSTNPLTGITKKRVKIKSSTLGITTTEKKQLKRHLQELSSALDELAIDGDTLTTAQTGGATEFNDRQRASSESTQQQSPYTSQSTTTMDQWQREKRATSYTPSRSMVGVSYSNTSSSGLGESPQSHVHWQVTMPNSGGVADNSDLDSEKSWSMTQLTDAPRSDTYRRFPQTKPSTYSGGLANLTDCDSECSLASDYSSYGSSSHRRFVSGTESDSCLGTAQSTTGKGLKVGKRAGSGLKLRLTSTLRNISRSITALASDSEAESTSSQAVGSKQKSKWMGRSKTSSSTGESSLSPSQKANKQQRENDVVGSATGSLKEIRV